MTVLEQQRQQIIVMDAASHTMSVVGAPKVAARPTAQADSADGATAVDLPAPDPGTAQSIAYNMLSSFGWAPSTYYSCLNNIWSRESGWRYNAENASGAYGIPQALPGSKMASAGHRSCHADQVGPGLYPGKIRRPLQGLGVLAGPRLLLSTPPAEDARLLPDAPPPGRSPARLQRGANVRRTSAKMARLAARPAP